MRTDMEDITALGGTLVRFGVDTWAWRDHSPAPKVRDMRLSDCYNFRCRTYGKGGTFVEVPTADAQKQEDLAWCSSYERSTSGDDTGERRLHDDGRITRASDRPSGGAIREVYLVPVEDWDARPPVGALWDLADEEAIFAKASELGWEQPQPN